MGNKCLLDAFKLPNFFNSLSVSHNSYKLQFVLVKLIEFAYNFVSVKTQYYVQTNKQTNKQTIRLFLLCASALVVFSMCKKQENFTENSSQQSSLSLTGNQPNDESRYLIFSDVNHFEEQTNRVMSMSDTEIAAYRDSLRLVQIIPLSDFMSPESEDYEGMERLMDVLNKDGIIQVGDSIIRICKSQNKAYILTPADTSYLTQLRNGTEVFGFIYIHENLDIPIFDIADEEAGVAGKRGLFCRDRWAESKEDFDESWDGFPNGIHLPTSNGVTGVRWKVRYNAAGAWFSLFVNWRTCEFRNNGIDFNTGANIQLRRNQEDVSFRARCAKNSHNWTIGIGSTITVSSGGNNYHSAPRALQRYNLRFWGEHFSFRNNNNNPNMNQWNRCFKWPLHIQSN